MARAPRQLTLVGGQIPGYNEFELDVESVLREQLPAFFEGIDLAPLTHDNVEKIPQGAKLAGSWRFTTRPRCRSILLERGPLA